MSLINVKCPECGYIFEAESENEKTACVKCNSEFSTERGSKFYKSFKKVEVDKLLVSKGETYLKVDSLLNKVEFYLDNEDFDNAKKLALEALELTPTNYRVYISLVYAYTENFKKLDDEEHVPYLKKAITLASDEQKKLIKSAYADYYNRRKMTKEEIDDYNTQEEAHLLKSLEKLLKDGLGKHFLKEKGLKPLFKILIILGVIPLLLTTPAIIFNNAILTISLFVSFIAVLIVFFKYYNDYSIVKTYNTALDLFDAYPTLNLEKEKSVKILNLFIQFAVNYLNGATDINLKQGLDEIIILMIENATDSTKKYFSSHKELKKYL